MIPETDFASPPPEEEKTHRSWLASNVVMWVVGFSWLGLTILDSVGDTVQVAPGLTEAWMVIVGALFANRYREGRK